MDQEKTEWAIVELLGHLKLAGRLSEEERFGCKMARLDIPTSKPCDACAGQGHVAFLSSTPCPACNGAKVETGFITQYFTGSSVYRISIVTEEVARHVNKQTAPSPVSPWDFPKQLPSPVREHVPSNSDREDDGYDRDPDF